jgi:CubicO group peptidase (beta-lactamase class C family)
MNHDVLPRVRPEEVGLSSVGLRRVSDALNAEIAAGNIPGAVLAIARRGKLAWLESYGMRDKALGAPMSTDTLFNVGAMVKPVTAVAALQLFEQAKLLVDDPLEKYFPRFSNMKVAILDDVSGEIIKTVPAIRPITIRDLMRHTSGIVYGGWGKTALHRMYPRGSAIAEEMTGPEFLDRLSQVPLRHQPGEVWDYGFGLDILGLVIEQVTNQKLGDYFRESVFTPLGMTDSGTLLPVEKKHRYALSDSEAEGPVLLDMSKPSKFEAGGAGLVSSPSDYLRFALSLLYLGKFNGTRILRRPTVQFMLSNQLTSDIKNLVGRTDPSRAGYGFGLGLAVSTPNTVAPILGSPGSFTWASASGTNWWCDPREELAVVFMAMTPGPLRWHYRRTINVLVYQAIDD